MLLPLSRRPETRQQRTFRTISMYQRAMVVGKLTTLSWPGIKYKSSNLNQHQVMSAVRIRLYGYIIRGEP